MATISRSITGMESTITTSPAIIVIITINRDITDDVIIEAASTITATQLTGRSTTLINTDPSTIISAITIKSINTMSTTSTISILNTINKNGAGSAVFLW